MSAMAAPGFDLAPDLTRYRLNILDTQAAGVVDPVEVIKALMFRLVFPGRHQHVGRYGPLIGFGLSRVSHEVPPPAPRHIMVIEEVIPERPAPWLGVDVVIGDPVIHG